MGTERIRPGGPFLRQTLGDSSSSELPSFVSTLPQVDYRLAAGFALVIASAVTPQGQGNAAQYQHGTHAQALHQAEIVKSDIFPSLRTPPAAPTPAPLKQLWAAPERIDLSIAGWATSGTLAPQGAVPSAIYAQQANPFQPQASVFKPAVAVTANPVAAFFATAPQTEERPSRAVFPSVVSGQTTPILPRINAGPQLADLTLQGSVFKAQLAAPVVSYAISSLYAAPQSLDLTQQASVFEPAVAPVVVSYGFRQAYGAPQSIDLTQQGWTLAPSPASQGGVPAGIFAPQADPSQLAAQITAAAVTPPVAATGPVPPFVLTRQDDPRQLAAQLWRSIDIGSPPAPPTVQQPGGEPLREPPRKRVPPRFKRHDLAHLKHLYDDFSEPEFLASVEQTLTEAAKPEKPALLAEIGELSALDILSRAYGVHFESVKAARELISERRLELVEEIPEEEMFAIMMILAIADEP